MCGIAGYLIKDNKRVRSISLHTLCRSLLGNIASRGRDATGYAYISNTTKKVCLAKAPVESCDFLNISGHLLSTKAPKVMPRTMLLHVRSATQGEPDNNQNNHPIYAKASGLCMVHNGWFWNDADIVKTHKLTVDAEVDSEVYLKLIEKYALSEKSVGRGIYKATEEFVGSIACGMIQASKPGHMWLWRDSGSLAVAEVDFGYVFASTKDALIQSLYTMHANDMSYFRLIQFPYDTLIYLSAQEDVPYEGKLSVPDYMPEPTFGHTIITYGETTRKRPFRSSKGAYKQNYDNYFE